MGARLAGIAPRLSPRTMRPVSSTNVRYASSVTAAVKAQPSGWSMVARRIGAIHRPDSDVVAVADRAGTVQDLVAPPPADRS